MADLHQLESEARNRQLRFTTTLDEVLNRLKPSGIAEEAARSIATILPPSSLTDAARKNPLVAMAIAAGTAWLVYQSERQSGSAPMKPKRRRISKQPSKETEP